MKGQPKTPEPTPDLFRSELKNILNLQHELCHLATLIDWDDLDKSFGEYFPSERGCPATPTRLVVGLFFLKALFNESDESLLERWVENPYWQYFCGEQYLQHKMPIDPSSLSRWRKRLKETDGERLLQETITVGLKTNTISKRDLKKVIVDTTVQEKNVTYPTDSKLYKKGIDLIVKEAKILGIKLKQSYKHVSKKALFKASNYGRAKQMKRAKKEVKKLKTYLGRIARDFKRKLEAAGNEASEATVELLGKVDRVLTQKRTDKNKLYSYQSPEVECIGKGKVHKRYEFGVKVNVVSTHRKNFVVGISSLPGNPFDGHTLKESLDQVERLVGKRPNETYADNGYRGHGEKESEVFVARQAKSRKTRAIRKAMKRRNAIEPLIGHMKQDGSLGRNYLKGKEGDQFNAVMSGIGYNLRVILKKIKIFLDFLLLALGLGYFLNLKKLKFMIDN